LRPPAEIEAPTAVSPRETAVVRSRAHGHGDRAWATALLLLGCSIFLVSGGIVLVLADLSRPLAGHHSIPQFLTGIDWDPVADHYGAAPFIYGTLMTSAIAILVALPVSVGLAVFMVEMAPRQLRPVVSFLIETLAAIPSVVFGLWGLFVLVPWLRTSVGPFLIHTLGFLPLFKGPSIGLGYLAAGLILAIMILPTVGSITIEVLKTVPSSLREAALALGATRWETIRLAVLPHARGGIVGAALLGLGRALGETMAVTMVIGNSPQIRASLLAPGYSLPSVIANEFAEATGAVHVAALAGLALVLLGISIALNAVAGVLVHATRSSPAGGHA
jgi:phosphate transport system permease protein